MKIVIISRIITPRLSPRAFRATELAKQLARMGHKVILYAVLGDYDYSDFCKETGIDVKNIRMHLSTANSDGKFRYNLFDKVFYHLFHKAIEYPDIEFCWKVPTILKNEKDVDLLITIAYPHPIHWGAAIAKKYMKSEFPKLWISDCGDPYMGSSVNTHPKYFRAIESFWGEMTDYITIPVEGARKGYSDEVQDKIRIIPQGFNFKDTPPDKYTQNPIPTFAYAGNIYPGQRDPSSFLEYLSSLQSNFEFVIFTNSPDYYRHYKTNLGDKLQLRDFIPREQLIRELSKMDFLINLTNPNVVQSPSKLIDYLLSQRPIVDISTPFAEINKIEQCLNGNLINDHKDCDISQYEIGRVADQFISLASLNNISK